MKKILVSIILLIIFCGGCSKKSESTGRLQEAIVGKWSSTVAGSQKITSEFTRDGILKTTFAGQTTSLPYKVLDDGTIEVNGKQKMKISISGNQLTINQGNETSTFLRDTGEQPSQGTISVGGTEAKPASAPPSSGGGITKAVLARGLSPLIHSPIDVADKFSPRATVNAIVSLANAPHDTRVKAAMTAIDTSNVIPGNTKIGETEKVAEGSQNVAFIWTPNSPYPPGTYKMEIYLNGKLDRTLNFSISNDAPAAAGQTAPPAVFGKCPAIPPSQPSAKFVFGVTMARGVDGQARPVNPGRIFPPTISTIYAMLTTENAPPNSRIAARWFATDVGGLEPCNSQINSSEMSISGSGRPYFSLSPGLKWPEGIYRVEIYENDHEALAVDFGVCDGPCKFDVPLSWRLQ